MKNRVRTSHKDDSDYFVPRLLSVIFVLIYFFVLVLVFV